MPASTIEKYAIIGGEPAGLSGGKALKELGIEFGIQNSGLSLALYWQRSSIRETVN